MSKQENIFALDVDGNLTEFQPGAYFNQGLTLKDLDGKIILKRMLGKYWGVCVDWSHTDHYRDRWRAPMDTNDPLDSIIGAECPD